MTVFLYVATRTSSVPHMEPMPVDTVDEARLYARRLLRHHDWPLGFQIYRDDLPVDCVSL